MIAFFVFVTLLSLANAQDSYDEYMEDVTFAPETTLPEEVSFSVFLFD